MISLARTSPAMSAVSAFVHRYRVLLAILATQTAIAFYARHILGSGLPTYNNLGQFLGILPYAAYAALGYRLVHYSYVEPVPNRIGRIKEDVKGFLADRARLAEGAAIMLLLAGGMAAFAQSKRLVTALQPFAWDETFARLDRLLFFGHDPWQLFHSLIGWNWLLSLLTAGYTFWFEVVFSTLIIAAFSVRNRLARMQFLIAHALIWLVVGTVMAIAFSSAGPVYFDRLGLGNLYLPLIERLDEHALYVTYSVRELQEQLWFVYDRPDSFSVISAMPSMHVASTFLIALYAFTASRLLGWLMAGFTALIFLGSFMLAWHYALDGIVSVIVVTLIWKFSGWLARRTLQEG